MPTRHEKKLAASAVREVTTGEFVKLTRRCTAPISFLISAIVNDGCDLIN